MMIREPVTILALFNFFFVSHYNYAEIELKFRIILKTIQKEVIERKVYKITRLLIPGG